MLNILLTIGIMLIINGITLYLSSCDKYTIFCEEKTACIILRVGILMTANILIWKAVVCRG